MKKPYFLTIEEIVDQGLFLNTSPLNHKVLRYADVLLVLAEATLIRGSGDGQAVFDQVRARAGLASKPLTMEALKLERRLELATERNRFHFLLRWGDAASLLSASGFTENRDEYLPIPVDDILLTGKDVNGNWILEQNPGYL